MKKIMMTLATLFVAVCASAQVYIGGGFSLANTSVDDDSYFRWKIAPEIGFQFDKKWDAGVSLGYTGVENGQKVFELAPYVRYTVCGSKVVEILSRELNVPMNEITKFGGNSKILFEKTK